MRQLLLALVWGYAAWVWTSMGHAFLGVPEIGPLVAAATALAILVRPLRFVDLRLHGTEPRTATKGAR